MAPSEHSAPEIDSFTGTATTGHEWDGIRELNTPLPRWWLNLLYATIIWSIAYWFAYPAWPLISDATRGVLGYATRLSVQTDLVALRAERKLLAADLASASLSEIRNNPALLRLALAQGKAAFGDNCVACHGLGGVGGRGYPNLNDDDWLWGGTLEAIHTTLLHGIRAANDGDTRLSLMPAFGDERILPREDIQAVANHVRSLAGLAPEPGADLTKGAQIFEQNCAGCHGPNGKGNQDLGAPNLTDAIWLYGNDLPALTQTIRSSRNGVMPAWGNRLDAATIKALTVYVHALGGGVAP